MSYQKERLEFVEIMTKEGISLDVTLKLMRYATTHVRLSVAACNGDYPADNGERKTVICPKCEMGWAKHSFVRGMCPDCRIEDLITKICEKNNLVPIFSGDPRGCTVKVKVPSGKTNDWGKEGICVPKPYL